MLFSNYLLYANDLYEHEQLYTIRNIVFAILLSILIIVMFIYCTFKKPEPKQYDNQFINNHELLSINRLATSAFILPKTILWTSLSQDDKKAIHREHEQLIELLRKTKKIPPSWTISTLNQLYCVTNLPHSHKYYLSNDQYINKANFIISNLKNINWHNKNDVDAYYKLICNLIKYQYKYEIYYNEKDNQIYILQLCNSKIMKIYYSKDTVIPYNIDSIDTLYLDETKHLDEEKHKITDKIYQLLHSKGFKQYE